MNRIHIMLIIPGTLFLCGCVPKIRMTVETRDGQGAVIERADVTSTDTSGRTFRASGNGTVGLTALAEDRNGLQALHFEGGFSCDTVSGGTGLLKQGEYSVYDPNLPGQLPTSETFYYELVVHCAGGTYSASIHACAANAKQGSTCTTYATLHAP